MSAILFGFCLGVIASGLVYIADSIRKTGKRK